MKVLTILGTRPEIIRLSRIMSVLDRVVEHKIVHTGQNYDYELNDVFFDELGVRRPNHFLEVNTSTLGRSLGEIIIKTEEVLLQEKPDAVLILGDTNSSVAILMAKRMKIPTYHMEAGNRSFDANVPEEINRKMVDHLSDFNLVYTEHARRNLISEGLPHRFTYLTGSPMREVLEYNLPKIKNSDILNRLQLAKGKYFIVSIHREENVDNEHNLRAVIDSLRELSNVFQYPIIVSTHPRTRNRLAKIGLDLNDELIHFLKPFGFIDYNQLQMNSFCAISDSGTISEESALLGFPAVTLRCSIERPEALDTATIALSGHDKETLVEGVKIATASRNLFSGAQRELPEEYKIRNTSERVVRLITGTAKLANRWRNLEEFSRYDWD